MLKSIVVLAIALLAQGAQQQTNSMRPAPADPSQMSLAERAALARKASTEKANREEPSNPDKRPPLKQEQRGSLRGHQYVNDSLHFRIELPGWEPPSTEVVAYSRAMARRWGEESSPNRVLHVKDQAGRMLSLTLVPLQQHTSLVVDDLAPGARKIVLEKVAQAQDLTNVKDYAEPVVWGSAAHRFAAFRVSCMLGNSLRVDSTQMTITNDFLLMFSVMGDSDQDVSDVLRSLKTALVWTTP